MASPASADQVTLKNGDRLTGTIVKSDGKTLLLKTDAAGDITLKWDAVGGIVSSQPLSLQLSDGKIVSGNVTTEDGKFEVATRDRGEVAATRDSVVAIRNGEEAYRVETLQYLSVSTSLVDYYPNATPTNDSRWVWERSTDTRYYDPAVQRGNSPW